MAAPSWEYAGVRLSIDNYIIPEEKLSPTPSASDGIDAETEGDLRFLGCELIQDSGYLLKLPQMAMATAQVLYQRFFYSKSFARHFYEHYSMASIFLAAKIEECPRRIRDVINVFHHIRQAREGRPFTPVLLDQSYINLKNQVIKAERRILKELGFCVHGKHPHKLVICYLQTLGLEKSELAQISWNYMNDVLRTDVFVRYFPEAVACACIFLAARKLGIPLPRYPPWWEMFNVDEESVHEIALCLQRLYVRSKPDVSALELRLAEIRKKQAEAREVALASSAASRSLNSRPLDDASSGNPSPSKAPVDNSKPDGSSRAAAVSPTSTAKPDPSLNLNTLAAHLSDLKGSRSRRSPEENRKPATDINLLNGGVQPGLKEDPDDISHQKSEKRRPSAYSEIDSKGRKRKTRCRSRSPMSRKGHVRSHRRRHSSSTNSDESYDSRSPPPRVHYSRSQEKGSRHSGYDYRKKSPASSDKYKSYKKTQKQPTPLTLGF
uniref:Cyclin-L2 n=1 Tax=Schistocephalus solidus TaxID=70667 RepID=A0A0X3NM32_SCHSO